MKQIDAKLDSCRGGDLLKYETKTEWVANHLRDSILSGQISPGERIRIQDWSKRLAVSATPIREALKALEAQGYVRISAHRSAEVTAFSSKEFSDSLKIQLALDSLAIDFAIQRLTGSRRTAACRRMKALNEDLGHALEAKDIRRAERLNVAFHKSVYEAADSPLLLKARAPIWSSIPVAGVVFWEAVAALPERIVALSVEHDAIADAIEAGDRQAALHHTRAHLEQGFRLLRQIEQEHTDGGAGRNSGRKSRGRSATSR